MAPRSTASARINHDHAESRTPGDLIAASTPTGRPGIDVVTGSAEMNPGAGTRRFEGAPRQFLTMMRQTFPLKESLRKVTAMALWIDF
jgi:hypothetical protein